MHFFSITTINYCGFPREQLDPISFYCFKSCCNFKISLFRKMSIQKAVVKEGFHSHGSFHCVNAAPASSTSPAQLLGSGSDCLLQPGTGDVAPAGMARFCGGVHLCHALDRRECHFHCCHPKIFISCCNTSMTRRQKRARRLQQSNEWYYSPQNFCSEAVSYSEMITRKVERNQLGRDHKAFIVQVMLVTKQKHRGCRMTIFTQLPSSSW